MYTAKNDQRRQNSVVIRQSWRTAVCLHSDANPTNCTSKLGRLQGPHYKFQQFDDGANLSSSETKVTHENHDSFGLGYFCDRTGLLFQGRHRYIYDTLQISFKKYTYENIKKYALQYNIQFYINKILIMILIKCIVLWQTKYNAVPL